MIDITRRNNLLNYSRIHVFLGNGDLKRAEEPVGRGYQKSTKYLSREYAPKSKSPFRLLFWLKYENLLIAVYAENINILRIIETH